MEIMDEESFSSNDFKRHVAKKYSRLSENEDERIMEAIIDLISQDQGGIERMQPFLKNVANLILRRFEFRTVNIGLKDPSDGKYRYVVSVGFSDVASAAMKNIAYTRKDMFDDTKFPAIKFGRNVEFSSVADEDETEWSTISLPSKIREPRTSIDQMTEGDYFHIGLHAGRNDLIGWIELGKTNDGKLPDRKTIKWLELISTTIARIIWEKRYMK